MVKVGILGCGWLGLPLGEFLVSKGCEVNGSTTKDEKLVKIREAGIKPFQIELNPKIIGENIANFLNINVLVIDIPPKLKTRDADFHVEQIKNLIKTLEVSSVEKIIFISSTSVYPELNREVFEEDVVLIEHSASSVLVTVENLLNEFCEKTNRKITILRCGGLMGYDRIPAKYFAGWKGLTTGGIQVNYIHRDDAIGVIWKVIEQNYWNETLNVVTRIHPFRKEIYEKNCKDFGYEMPEFVEPNEPQPFKIVSSKKLLEKLKYEFIYANPLTFKYL
jgi:nucleoside-diphosphate-sugar epimerase